MVTRRGASDGFLLAEACISAALIGLMAVCLSQLLSRGVEGAARSGEHQLAVVLGARVMDRVLATGYAGLTARPDDEAPIDISTFGEPSDDASPDPAALTVDGVRFTGVCRIERADAGLLRVRVTLTWRRTGGAGNRAPCSFSLIRYVADPEAGVSVREPFGVNPV